MSKQDWTKFVTIDPPAFISFIPETTTEGQGTQATTWLTLINKSEVKVMFKVKTTSPNSYLVRPNQGIVDPDSKLLVKVIFNKELDSEVSNTCLNYV